MAVHEPQPIVLLGIDAKLRGQNLWNSEGYVANWKDMKAVVEWPIAAIAGAYDLQLTYALGVGPSSVTVEVAGQTVNGNVATTKNWDTYVPTTKASAMSICAVVKPCLLIKAGPGAKFSMMG